MLYYKSSLPFVLLSQLLGLAQLYKDTDYLLVPELFTTFRQLGTQGVSHM